MNTIYASILFVLIFTFSIQAQSPFDLTKVQKLSLDFHEANWENKLKAFKKSGNDERIAARLTLGAVQFDSVGVRFKGNSSYNNPRKKENRKLPFNIDINEYHKKAKFPDKTNKIKLSNSFRDPTFVREILSYEIIRNYLPMPQIGFYHLFVNGEDYGLYIGTSSINKRFLKNNFNTKKGLLFKCDPDYNDPDDNQCAAEQISNLEYFADPACYENRYELKSKKGWKALLAFIKSLNEKPESLNNSLAIYETLWMHALNTVLVNFDSYSGRLSHNYYLYQDTFKIWHPLMWDLNLSFGGFAFDGLKNDALTAEELMNHSIFAYLENPKRPLISQLLKNSLYRKIYVHNIKTICEDYFLNGKYLEMIAGYQALIRPVVMGAGKRLYNPNLFTENISSTVKVGRVEIMGIQELVEGRMNFLQSTPIFAEGSPKVNLAQGGIQDSVWQVELQTESAEEVLICTQSMDKGPWKRSKMSRDANFQSLTAERWHFTTAVDEQPFAYFFVLENKKFGSLYPRNAPQEAISTD